MNPLSSPVFVTSFIDDVWNLGDVEAVERYVATRYTIHHDPGDPWEGQCLDLDGYRDRLVRSRAAFPDQTFDVQRMCGDDTAVVMTWLGHGAHLGDLPGFPATGRTIRMSGATTYLIGPDGRLTGHWQVADRLGVWRQLQAGATGVPA